MGNKRRSSCLQNALLQVSHAFSRSVVQPASQSVSQPVSQAIGQSVSKLVSQSIGPLVGRTINRSISQSLCKSVSPSEGQSVSQSVSQSVRQTDRQTVCQSNRTSNQPANSNCAWRKFVKSCVAGWWCRRYECVSFTAQLMLVRSSVQMSMGMLRRDSGWEVLSAVETRLTWPTAPTRPGARRPATSLKRLESAVFLTRPLHLHVSYSQSLPNQRNLRDNII